MPWAWVWTLVLPLLLIRLGLVEAGWDPRSQGATRDEETEAEAMVPDLDILSELEMLQLLDMLQELEILTEIDPGLVPGSERGDRGR